MSRKRKPYIRKEPLKACWGSSTCRVRARIPLGQGGNRAAVLLPFLAPASVGPPSCSCLQPCRNVPTLPVWKQHTGLPIKTPNLPHLYPNPPLFTHNELALHPTPTRPLFLQPKVMFFHKLLPQ